MVVRKPDRSLAGSSGAGLPSRDVCRINLYGPVTSGEEFPWTSVRHLNIEQTQITIKIKKVDKLSICNQLSKVRITKKLLVFNIL